MKNKIQNLSALALLFSGVALSVAGFCTAPRGEISESVLWYFAQTLIYAGSVFGVSSYIDVKFDELRKYGKEKTN